MVEDDHNAEVGGAAAHTLAAAGLDRWAQVRTVSKHLGIDLRWAGVACDAVTLARHDRRMVMTSGWVSHVLQETVAALLADPAVRDLVAAGEEAYAERRAALIGALGAYGIRAVGASGLNVWVPVRDESAVVNGLRTQGWWVAAGARFRWRLRRRCGSPRRGSRPWTRCGSRRTSPGSWGRPGDVRRVSRPPVARGCSGAGVGPPRSIRSCRFSGCGRRPAGSG
ncbi:hypothetical protein O1L60_06145 [Streptomyces diastatochromogenes]|nr:hypothetical protein [Streptomyces diastatochromogenes]